MNPFPVEAAVNGSNFRYYKNQVVKVIPMAITMGCHYSYSPAPAGTLAGFTDAENASSYALTAADIKIFPVATGYLPAKGLNCFYERSEFPLLSDRLK